eukprot:55329_1
MTRKSTKHKGIKAVSKPITQSQPSLWREALNESAAGVTDSLFTQLLLTLCYFLYTRNDFMQKYFHSGYHIYWLFYFIHLNILDSFIWGQTYRNSVAYILDKPKQSILRTLCIIFCQYMSIFAGAWLSIQCVEYIYDEDPTFVTQLTHEFVGVRDRPASWTDFHYIRFICQAMAFQLTDRFVGGIIATFSPLIKRNTIIFDGMWTQTTLRCILMHYLIVSHNPVGIIINANYGFYANLYYWRWSRLDMIILILPYLSIPIWKATFAKLSILHNPNYFQTKKK